MKIFSEKTNKEYGTVEECLKAEKAYDADVAEKAKKQLKLVEERKARAKEVETAFKVAQDAQKNYLNLRNKFVKDYGSFHMTFSNCCDSYDPFESFLKFF